MSNVTAWIKQHKGIVLGGLLGVLLFYYILKHSAAASSTTSGATDLSGGGQQVQALTAAASLQNASVNGQVEVAQLQASVADAQVAASLQADLAKTAAELSATNQQTAASVAITSLNDNAAVEVQRIVSGADVAKTSIEAQTYVKLGAQHADVASQMIKTVAAQIKQIQEHSKHASQDYGAIAPIIALETGQGAAAPGIANANAAGKVGQAQAEAGAASSIFGSLMSGLFGK